MSNQSFGAVCPADLDYEKQHSERAPVQWNAAKGIDSPGIFQATTLLLGEVNNFQREPGQIE